MLLAIQDVSFRGLGVTVLDKDLFNKILNILHRGNATIFIDDLEDTDNLSTDLGSLLHIRPADGFYRLTNSRNDLLLFKCDKTPIPFTNKFQHLHTSPG